MIEKSISNGEIKLKARDYGTDHPAVIFLHFGGGNMQMWRDVVPFFTEQYRVVLLDLRGHGHSDKPASGYHIDQLAEDVVAVMENLGIEAAHLVGSSLGAEVALSLAANYPDRVKSLVCEGALFNESGPYGMWKGTDAAFQEHKKKTLHGLENRPVKRYPSVDAIVAESEKSFSEMGWWSDVFEQVVRYDAAPDGEGNWVKSWDRIAHAYMRHAFTYNFGDYYARVRCPVLLLPDTYPGQDAREVEIMNGLFALIQNGKIVYVPEWVHPFGWMLAPEGGSKAVLDFIADIEAG